MNSIKFINEKNNKKDDVIAHDVMIDLSNMSCNIIMKNDGTSYYANSVEFNLGKMNQITKVTNSDITKPHGLACFFQTYTISNFQLGVSRGNDNIVPVVKLTTPEEMKNQVQIPATGGQILIESVNNSSGLPIWDAISRLKIKYVFSQYVTKSGERILQFSYVILPITRADGLVSKHAAYLFLKFSTQIRLTLWT